MPRRCQAIAAFRNLKAHFVVTARSRVVLRELLPQRAHGHAHDRMLGAVERRVFAEDVERDLGFLRHLVAQRTLDEIARELPARLGLAELLGDLELREMSSDEFWVDIDHAGSIS